MIRWRSFIKTTHMMNTLLAVACYFFETSLLLNDQIDTNEEMVIMPVQPEVPLPLEV